MTAPLSSISGLISGIQYRDLIDQIIQAESQPAQRLTDAATAATKRLDLVKQYGTLLDALKTAAKGLRDGSAFRTASTTVTGATGASGRTTLTANAVAGAAPGSYQVEVLSVAQAEKLSGAAFASAATPLGLTGDFFVNGVRVTVSAGDALGDIRSKINAADSGTAPSRVSASVLTTNGASRLVLTSDQSGKSGIDLVDGSGGVLQSLGVLDSGVAVKRQTSAGMASDRFGSSSTAIGTLRGLTASAGPQLVTVAGQTVTIDLATDSLDGIATKLSALTGVTATVKSETTGAATTYYLDVHAPAGVADAGHTLELLGFVKGGRSAVAQTVRGAALTAGDASTPATAATQLSSLWNGGAASGVQAGDTLTIAGTRGDGSAVNLSYTVTGSDTVQDVLDALNNATTGFGAGTRPAVASIDAQGRIQLTDGASGDSQLSLSIVAQNQGGGRLDLGAFGTAQLGRSRVLAAGSDATIKVDGVTLSRTSNAITDAIADLTINVQAVDPGTVATIKVERSSQSALGSAQAFVDAYNKIVDLIKQQNTPGANGAANPPLYNDSALRLGRGLLPQTLLASITGAAGGLATAGAAGLSLGKDGKLSLDQDKFNAAYNGRYDDLRKLFMENATTSSTELTFVSSAGKVAGGSYAVAITAAATQASAAGTGFAGIYADDGTADSMTVTDTASGAAATVALANGMTTAQIVDALNASFAAATKRVVTNATTLYSDAGGTTPAGSTTTFADLRFGGGGPTGVAAGDTITLAGVRANGTSFSTSFTITNPATQTLGDLATALQSAIGAGATVSVSGGKSSVQADQVGSSPLTFSLTANNQGGGTLSFGGASVPTPGRGIVNVTASAAGNQVVLTHNRYGASDGFSVGYAAGGGDGTAQVGLAAGARTGTNVAGTINGYAATGVGQQLVGAGGTPVDGLAVRYTGNSTATASLDLVVGVGAQMERLLDSWLGTGGTLDNKETDLKANADRLSARAAAITARLATRRETLLKQFAQMETSIARLKQQSASVLALGQQQSGSNQ